MELSPEQISMLRQYGQHTSGIGWIDHGPNCVALVEAGYLKLAFNFAEENYYGITKAGRIAIRNIQMG